MEVVQVKTGAEYDVRIGRGLLSAVGPGCADFSRCAVLSDENVAPLYRAQLAGLQSAPTLAVPAGEGSKSFATLERVLDFMVAAGLDRRSCLVALGGGVVGDLGGLAASLYMRGIALVQVPTTLLAQVDSSVGGKTAVNLRAGKNLAGSFHPPSLVIADTDTLASLSAEEYRSGLGEVVKSALIGGEQELAELERTSAAIVAREPETLAQLIASCVRTKARIVAEDPHERGLRKSLNLGHTFAHGIEHAAGYGTIPHGIAVGVGLLLALRASAELGVLRDPALPARTRSLMLALGLPVDLAALRQSSRRPLEPAQILAGMRHDKKGSSGQARLVLPVRTGELRLDVEAGGELLERCLAGV